MLFSNKLPLKIHCWGGLGSQLLALNYYLEVQEKFPGKQIILVLHTGGITARSSEIDFLGSKINLLKVDDYHAISSKALIVNKGSRSLMLFIKFYMKVLANFFRFVITDDRKISQVSFWTNSVRCTYTTNILKKQGIVHMANILTINAKDLESNFLGVHFRMGDLPTLKPESLVPFSSISAVIIELLKADIVVNRVKIFSDSRSDTSNLQLPEKISSEWKSVETLQTIRELSRAKYFIGTSSKVSLWIAIFRWALDTTGDIYLPNSVISQFVQLTNINRAGLDSLKIKIYNEVF